MVSKRKPAKPAKSILVKNVGAALRGVRSAISAGRKPAAARAKKAKSRADAAELQRIENLLGEDFDSLSQARRAIARETKSVSKKQAAAFRAREKEKLAPAPPAAPRKRKPAPVRSTPPARAAARPKASPAPPAPGITIADISAMSLSEGLDAIRANAAALDAQLPPGAMVRVNDFFGNGTKNLFSSFGQAAQFIAKYKRKQSEKTAAFTGRIQVVTFFAPEVIAERPQKPSEFVAEQAAARERRKHFSEGMKSLERQVSQRGLKPEKAGATPMERKVRLQEQLLEAQAKELQGVRAALAEMQKQIDAMKGKRGRKKK